MDAGDAVRAARRTAGLGQAGFAREAAVSERALCNIEAGSSDPRWSTVVRLLQAAGLELTVVPSLPEPTRALVRYLSHSTSRRLQWSFSGDLPIPRGGSPAWQELRALTPYGAVHLVGAAAVGAWLPVRMTLARLSVVLHSAPGVDPPHPLHGEHLNVRVDDGPSQLGQVPVYLGGRRDAVVLVAPPLLLAAHPDCTEVAQDLRVAARLLQQDRARDQGQRRSPAHRDPDEVSERGQVMIRHAYRDRELPDAYDSRAWRLSSSASLATWLQQHPQRSSISGFGTG